MDSKKNILKKKHNYDALVMGKMPPQSLDLETIILGSLLMSPKCILKVRQIIKSAEVFYSDANQRICSAIYRLDEAGMSIDFMLVCEELRRSGELEMVGGSYYVTSLTQDFVSAANIEAHCRIINQKYISRELIRLSATTIAAAYDDDIDVFDQLQTVEDNQTKLVSQLTSGQYRPMMTIVDEYLKDIQKPAEKNELRMFFRDIDNYLGPLKPGCMYVVAARPGMGKTSFLISSTLEQSKRFPIGIWNGELTSKRFINRYMCNLLNKSSKELDELIKKNEFQTFIDGATDLLSDHKLFFDETSGIDVDDLVSLIKYWVHVCGVRVVWLDYLNLIQVSEERQKYNSREQQVYYILMKLSKVCKECNIPLILLAQLNRDVLKSADKIPNLSHLKEAGRIEEMVYHVGFLNRPEEYGIMEDHNGSTKGRVDYLIRKNSDGQNSVDVNMLMQPQFFKIYDDQKIEFVYQAQSPNTPPPASIGEIPF